MSTVEQSASKESLTWIFGSSRSGSTWLSRMLAELHGVAVIDDPHIGHHLGVWRPIPLAWATASEPPALRTLDEIKAPHDSYFFSERYRSTWEPGLRKLILDRFRAEAAERTDSDQDRHIVVKEPGSQAASMLLEIFPSSNLIFLIRDGRDVIDSWLDAYSEGSWAIEEGAYPVSEEGRLPLIEWLATVWVTRMEVVGECFDRMGKDQRVMIRYEQMREDPRASLRAICELASIAADETELSRSIDRHCFEKTGKDRRGKGKAIRSATPGAWRDGLSEDEQEAAMRIMGPTLTELGYETKAVREPLRA